MDLQKAALRFAQVFHFDASSDIPASHARGTDGLKAKRTQSLAQLGQHVERVSAPKALKTKVSCWSSNPVTL